MASWRRLNLGAGLLKICTVQALNPFATLWCVLPVSLSFGMYSCASLAAFTYPFLLLPCSANPERFIFVLVCKLFVMTVLFQQMIYQIWQQWPLSWPRANSLSTNPLKCSNVSEIEMEVFDLLLSVSVGKYSRCVRWKTAVKGSICWPILIFVISFILHWLQLMNFF